MKTNNLEPWGVNTPWKTSKDYFNWLRSQTRRIWSRHPIKIQYKLSRRYKAPLGLKGKDVWVSDCEICKKASRTCEVDHLTAGGSFSNWEEYTEWSKRILFVTYNDIRELCKECHSTVTLSQRLNISFEEAAIHKEMVTIVKDKKDKDFFISRKLVPPSNLAQRKTHILKILTQEKDTN